MSFRSLRLPALVLPLAVLAASAAIRQSPSTAPASKELRVCADPNNMPFSNSKGEGLENRLADLIAHDLGAKVRYTWWPQRRGFFRSTLNAGRCDVVMGVPSDLPMVSATRPYYRSHYVLVTRADRKLTIKSLDDPILRRLRIGVQVVGDGANTPPLEALARRGITRNLVGFTVFGDYDTPNPPARIMDAVAAGEVDLAIVWGPLAGFFVSRERAPLKIAPVPDDAGSTATPLAFAISVGVRKGDEARRASIDRVLSQRENEIERLLNEYGVPRDHTRASS
jgi:mxaJ protein